MGVWKFWVDRGGTFTDILAITPDQTIVSKKLLSEDPDHYQDAVVEGVKRITQQTPEAVVEQIKMGTTVATNALLERRGEDTLFITTEGFADLLTIRSQHRQHLFKQSIEKPEPVYYQVITVSERLNADGEVIRPLDIQAAKSSLQQSYDNGLRSVAIALMHACINPEHEQMLGKIAHDIGFQHISLSHQISPFPKLLERAETTVADAYLSPVLNRYLSQLQNQLGDTPMLFMQSNGDLTEAAEFSGKDAVLSGPAGGIVAMARTAAKAGFDKVIGFDMGGTSTDVSLFTGEFDLSQNNEIAGIHLRVPMLSVHTVAAGGGSQLWFDGQRFRVGPESAGAYPGPVSYGKQGHLAVTDINVLCGKIQPEYFPNVFGNDGQQPIDVNACQTTFEQLAESVNQQTGLSHTPHSLASDFLNIAVNSMANAIKTISTQKGIELDEFTLNAFGGAGGQHACLVAEELGVNRVFVHAHSSLLSAYGMGCSYIGKEDDVFYGKPLEQSLLSQIQQQANTHLADQKAFFSSAKPEELTSSITLYLHYENSEQTLSVALDELDKVKSAFESQHEQQFGFINQETPILVKQAVFKTTQEQPLFEEPFNEPVQKPSKKHAVWFGDRWLETEFIPIESIALNKAINGPAVIYDSNTTLVVEPGWQAEKIKGNNFVLTKLQQSQPKLKNDTQLTPTRLEIFNNLYMHIAEQMGAVLQQTAHSVNIKERLDFSCALFNQQGDLIANAPHMPVHLGSMSDSVRHIINSNKHINAGDCFMMNSPYHGGTHLPDITVISPVFVDDKIHYWVASRGHHADIGGTTPGSMPASSNHIEQEGVIIENFKLIDQHQLQRDALKKLLTGSEHPVRNFHQTLADLQAQIAANQRGIQELLRAVEQYGNQTVKHYMEYVQDNAEQAIINAIEQLAPGKFSYPMDNGATINVSIEKTEQQQLLFDFTGTSEQQNSNFNAPLSVTRAAVLYVLRSLVTDDIPLNEGCLRPVLLKVPQGTLLNPKFPAAVVAGNVETSQAVTDAIFGALQWQAAAQGSMNNLTFGDQQFQYYETICGGSGAGKDYPGTDAIQTHMTNSRITDPEIIEQRFPVILEQFSVRNNSGGRGQFFGGNGVIRRFRFTQSMTVSILSNNRKNQPFGMHGGEPGKAGINRHIKLDGSRQQLAACCELNVKKDEQIEIETPGGGGYGLYSEH